MAMVYGLEEEDENDRLKRLRSPTGIYGDTAPSSSPGRPSAPTGVPGSTISQTSKPEPPKPVGPEIAIETDRRTGPDTADPRTRQVSPPPARRDPYASPTTTATIGPPPNENMGPSPKGAVASGGAVPIALPKNESADTLLGGQGIDRYTGPENAAGSTPQNPDWYGQLWGMTQNQPEFGGVAAAPSAQTQGLTDRLAAVGNQAAPQIGGYNAVDPTIGAQTQGLNQGSTDLAMQMLSQPTRYDTDLFQQLFQGGLAELDQRNERAKVDTLRDSTRRLGPQSGQLTNEYIDLEAEFGQQRTGLLNNLAREAALTQMQDRLGALQGAQGVSGQLFGQDQSLRGEQRTERGFQRDTDVFNVGQQNQQADRLQSIQGQNFAQDQSLRGEERQERDFGVQDRLREFNEVDRFGQVDRQLGRDAMDDYYRQQGAESQSNEALARLMQSEFANNMALAQLFANMPGAVDPGDGTTPVPETPTDPLMQNAQRQTSIRGYITNGIPEEEFIRSARAAGMTDDQIQRIMAEKKEIDGIGFEQARHARRRQLLDQYRQGA